MISNISLFTYGVAALCYLALCVMLLTQWRVRPLGPGLLAAAASTFVWASAVALGTLPEYPPISLIQYAELARNACWMYFLLQLLGFQEDGDVMSWLGHRWLGGLALLTGVAAGVLALRPLSAAWLAISLTEAADAALMLWLALSIVALLLVEQVYRNARTAERWGVKFLCLSLGALFAYDLFMYAEALLFRHLNAQLWQARGLISVLVLPWLVLAIARNRNWRLDVHVSRQMVFHTVTLMAAGIYLLCMAVIGYFIKFMGGNWGGVLQIGFVAGSATLLATLLFSGTLRARLRVFLSKHFFSYRYDYREEWLRFTQGLAALGENAGQGIIQAMAEIALSSGGLLLARSADNRMDALSTWELDAPESPDLGGLPSWLATSGWVIDLDEWRESPDLYDGLELPEWLQASDTLWLIVPLLFNEQLEGLVLLTRTDLKKNLNWEDRDLLKTAGRQAAALLAQQRASNALVEARQFDAFNRLSAYVIHDLKNILAQQSLMVSNARKHRDNPAFIDDMISTVEHSVERMQRLMHQMRSELRSSQTHALHLPSLLEQVVATHNRQAPVPALTVQAQLWVNADNERLTTVFGHLLQNAQEATAEDGEVQISVDQIGGMAEVCVRDSGSGMTAEFIRDRLFKPFESTKGLTGMGIGAFESREYLRQLGGDISVQSQVGVGSVFKVTLPSAEPSLDDDAHPPTADAADCDLDTPTNSSPVAH